MSSTLDSICISYKSCSFGNSFSSCENLHLFDIHVEKLGILFTCTTFFVAFFMDQVHSLISLQEFEIVKMWTRQTLANGI